MVGFDQNDFFKASQKGQMSKITFKIVPKIAKKCLKKYISLDKNLSQPCENKLIVRVGHSKGLFKYRTPASKK